MPAEKAMARKLTLVLSFTQETWTSTLKSAQGSWSEAVATEIATEAQKPPPTSNPEGEESETSERTPDESLSANRMLSYHKPIESHC